MLAWKESKTLVIGTYNYLTIGSETLLVGSIAIKAGSSKILFILLCYDLLSTDYGTNFYARYCIRY